MKLSHFIAGLVAAAFASTAQAAIFTYDIDDLLLGGAGVGQTAFASVPPANASFGFGQGSVDAKLMLDEIFITTSPLGSPILDGFMAELSDQEGFGSTEAIDVTPSIGTPSSGMIEVRAGQTVYFNFKWNSLNFAGYEASFSASPTSVVPLPSALPLIAAGLAALGWIGVRRRAG